MAVDTPTRCGDTWETSGFAKFLLRLKLKSNTAFFLAMFLLFLVMLWSLRNHRKRKLEIAQEEKQDQIMFIAGSLFFLLALVPFLESFRPQPYNSTMGDRLPGLGKPSDESAFERGASRVHYAILGMSLSEIDFIISGIICLIVLLVSMMCWPKPCDTCDTKLAPMDQADAPHTVVGTATQAFTHPESVGGGGTAAGGGGGKTASPTTAGGGGGGQTATTTTRREGPVIELHESRYSRQARALSADKGGTGGGGAK